jgi:hypothetical protein
VVFFPRAYRSFFSRLHLIVHFGLIGAFWCHFDVIFDFWSSIITSWRMLFIQCFAVFWSTATFNFLLSDPLVAEVQQHGEALVKVSPAFSTCPLQSSNYSCELNPQCKYLTCNIKPALLIIIFVQ